MRFGSREGSYLLSEMLTRSLPTVSRTMAIDALVVENGHQMACRPRLLAHLCLRLGRPRLAGRVPPRSLAGTGTGVAWRAER